ncbi:MAG: SDR family oxidoreductase [Pseudomonadota bacterium]
MNYKNAVITGASSGIGAEYASQLAPACDSLLLIARRVERLDSLAARLSSKCDVRVLEADLSTQEGLARCVEAMRQGPDVDLLVNNAGTSFMGPFANSCIDDELQMVRVHVDATMVLTRAVLPGMRVRRQGAVVNVASIGGFIEAPNVATYAATKAFLVSFSRSLKRELRDAGVAVQCLCPGYTRTEIHDLAGMDGFDKQRVPDELWMESSDVVGQSLLALAQSDPPWLLVTGSQNVAHSLDALNDLNRLVQRCLATSADVAP